MKFDSLSSLYCYLYDCELYLDLLAFSSASGYCDRFADDRGDICEYIDESNTHVVRPTGIHGDRGGRSSGSVNGDPFVAKRGDRGKDIDKGNRTWPYPPILIGLTMLIGCGIPLHGK